MKTVTLPILAFTELVAFTAIAHAQSSAEPSAGNQIEEITVTGSRIRGHENPAAQVYTVTSKDIEEQGLLSTDDVFRSIPQASRSGSAQAMSINTLAPGGSQGHSTINLGGFGAKSTLVLVNGRRTANASILFGDSVSVSTIPTSAIERIDVLPTAAAAVYGADAIGGVVNIILKKRSEFEANTSVSFEDSSTGGNARQFSQDLSFGWHSGRFTGVANYRESDPVKSRDLGYTTQDFRSRGGYDLRYPTFGATGIITGLGSLPADHPGTAFAPGDVSQANVTPVSGFLNEELFPTQEAKSVYISAEQDVAPSVSLFLDAIYSENDATQYEYPLVLFSAAVPASNAFNPFGETVNVTYQFDTERAAGLMPATFRGTREQLKQGTLGAEIELPRDWHLTVYGTRAEEASFHTFTLLENNDPALIAALADSNPQTALNIFGNGTAQNATHLDSIVRFFLGRPDVELSSTMTQLVAQADGELFVLPTGVVKASVVAEYREDEYDSTGFGAGRPKGTRTARAAGAEFAVPLLNRATGQQLDLTLATRWDQYSAEGNIDPNAAQGKMRTFSANSPMAGLAWKPIPDLRLRASWNKAFRAPVIRDLAALPGTQQRTVLDPLAPGGAEIVTVTASFPGSPDLGPEKARIWTAGADWRHVYSSGSELSASITYNNTDFRDRIIGSFVYFQQDPAHFISHPELFPDSTLRNANGTLTDIFLRNINLARQKAESWYLDTDYKFTASGQHFSLKTAVAYAQRFEDEIGQGAPVQKLEGTFNGPDRWRGTFQAGWISPGDAWAGNLLVHASSSYRNLIATSNILNPPADAGTTITEKVAGYTTVDLTGSYRYHAGNSWYDGLSITGGVRNMFDKDYPFINVTVATRMPFDPRRVDLRGRVFFVQLGKKFN